MSKIESIFSTSGELSKIIPGFRPRDVQLKMANAVAEAIQSQNKLVVEAQTGTGKTFAYLVPALSAKKKIIISTGSKNLQDQLYNRDLPTITKALNYTGVCALLKGRGNYLCLHRFQNMLARGILGGKELLTDLKRIRHWKTRTQTGDFAEITNISENSPIFSQLACSSGSCLDKECSFFKNEECYLVKARKKALNSDILVVNHHLFCADMAMKENSFGKLIPDADVIIFDEAHQVPDIATQYFSETLTTHQFFEFCRDLSLLYRTELKDLKQLEAIADNLKKHMQDLRLAIGEESNLKARWKNIYPKENVQKALDVLLKKCAIAEEVIDKEKTRSEDLANLYERLIAFGLTLNQFTKFDKTECCYWVETSGQHCSFHITPLSIAEHFSRQMNQNESTWIFTSATLEVNGKFDHFNRSLGIYNPKTLSLESPFDYPNQAVLCVPRDLPPSNSQGTLEQLAKRLLPVIIANRGRCFVLCTSYSMMRGFAEYFRKHSNLNVLLQGEKSKATLLDEFVSEDNSVLVATSSFWEGIDVRGEALSLVIIDKLPFEFPDEPLLQDRSEYCRKKGGNPFAQIQIPQAVITLKQGVGRLIRDVDDRGAVIICDSRLVMKNYAESFLKSLPNAKRTRSLDNVVQFLTSLQQEEKL